MKKILFALIAVLACAVFAEAPKWPGWNVKDVAVWQEYITKGEAENNAWAIGSGRIMLAIAQNEPATFADLVAIAENSVKGLEFAKDTARNARETKTFIDRKVGQVCLYKSIFSKDGFNYCKESQIDVALQYCISRKKLAEISDREVYDVCYRFAIRFQKIPYQQSLETAINKLVEIGADLEDTATVKANLETLNRKLSLRLLEDKRFEQVIAKIRTALATY